MRRKRKWFVFNKWMGVSLFALVLLLISPTGRMVITNPLQVIYLLKAFRLMLSTNQPVKFYARVLDLHGHPVSGAALSVVITRVDKEKVLRTFPNIKFGEELQSVSQTIYSDVNGRLKLEGQTGKSLIITELSKNGFFSEVGPNYDGIINEANGEHRASVHAEILNAIDATKKYNFHLWKIEGGEPLIPINFTLEVEPYGSSWYFLNLFRGVVTNVGDSDFSFRFEMEKDANGKPARHFTFAVQNGGLMLDSNDFPYSAPSEGYAPTCEWDYEPYGVHANANLSHLLNKKFYVKARSGQIYAHLLWKWNGTVSISGDMNTSASRNLEPDPAKLITDPAEIQRWDERTRVE